MWQGPFPPMTFPPGLPWSVIWQAMNTPGAFQPPSPIGPGWIKIPLWTGAPRAAKFPVRGRGPG